LARHHHCRGFDLRGFDLEARSGRRRAQVHEHISRRTPAVRESSLRVQSSGTIEKTRTDYSRALEFALGAKNVKDEVWIRDAMSEAAEYLPPVQPAQSSDVID